jgi:CO/xanthine dehydrogenase FAD-binding subunit
MPEAEVFLKGESPDEEVLQKASLKISEAMIRQSGVRPSTSYKKPVVEVLFVRAMRKALEG